jgi:hypothetical protein
LSLIDWTYRPETLAFQRPTARGTVGDLFGVGLTAFAVIEEYPLISPFNPPELPPEFVPLLARAI